jgi:Domain of unknown function (DUF4382)
MNNTRILTVLAAAATITLCIASCKKNESTTPKAGNSSAAIFLADDPSPVFDNLFIDIQKVEVKAEDDSEAVSEQEHQAENDDNDRHGATTGGWVSLDIQPGIYDLLKFRNGIDTALGTINFSNTRNLKKIRLTLGASNHGIINGVSIPLVIKDNDNIIVINLEKGDVSGTGQFQLSVDIDAGRSVRQNGNGFELLPRARSFNRSKTGSIEGEILPAEAKAIVYVINGTDTASAIPEREGEFRISGLKDGRYTLLAHATANNYTDTSVQVVVQGKEDTHVDAIILHK